MNLPRRNPAVPPVDALTALASLQTRRWLEDPRHLHRVLVVAQTAIASGAKCAEVGQEVVYDAEGRRYQIAYRFVPVFPDGRTVTPSHSPVDLSEMRGYPAEFQTRDLSDPSESVKIQQIALHFDPVRLLGHNLDATLGPPVVWPGPDRRLYVLGGNGRTIAFMRTSDADYQRYLTVGRCMYVDFPADDAPSGSRWMLVRVLVGASPEQAVQLAGASQLSTSAEEGRVGKALGMIRGLAIRVDDLPPFEWTKPIAPDNVEAFREANPAFVNAILGRMDYAKRARYNADSEALASVVSAVMIAFLPKEARNPAVFAHRKVEDAFIGALPAILTSHSMALHETIYPEYDLLPHLAAATNVFEYLRKRRMTFAALAVTIDEERRNARVGNVSRISDTPDVAIALAAALTNASRRSAPEDAVAEILSKYLREVSQWNPRAPSLGFGGPARRIDPGEVLADCVPKFKAAAEAVPDDAPPPSMFGMRSNRGR